MIKMIPALTWYLEMTDRTPAPETPLPDGYSVLPFTEGRDAYLAIYQAVGADFNWFDRILMPHEKLDAIIKDSHTEIMLLKYGMETAGFVEFSHTEGETEIVYFGLTPPFTGKKVGFPFLQWAIHHALKRNIRRLWLHTCDLDHPAALPLYQKAGFVVYKKETVMQPILS